MNRSWGCGDVEKALQKAHNSRQRKGDHTKRNSKEIVSTHYVWEAWEDKQTIWSQQEE